MPAAVYPQFDLKGLYWFTPFNSTFIQIIIHSLGTSFTCWMVPGKCPRFLQAVESERIIALIKKKLADRGKNLSLTCVKGQKSRGQERF